MEQRKYQKTYELKQVIKAYAEYLKYCRLTRKQTYDEIYDKMLDESKKNLITLLSEYNLVYKSYSGKEYPKYEVRLFYIAYGLLRKKPYNVIEQPKEENALTESDWEKINEIMEIFKEENVEVENV